MGTSQTEWGHSQDMTMGTFPIPFGTSDAELPHDSRSLCHGSVLSRVAAVAPSRGRQPHGKRATLHRLSALKGRQINPRRSWCRPFRAENEGFSCFIRSVGLRPRLGAAAAPRLSKNHAARDWDIPDSPRGLRGLGNSGVVSFRAAIGLWPTTDCRSAATVLSELRSLRCRSDAHSESSGGRRSGETLPRHITMPGVGCSGSAHVAWASRGPPARRRGKPRLAPTTMLLDNLPR